MGEDKRVTNNRNVNENTLLVETVYGKILQWIVLAGLVLLVLTYGIYVSGTLPSTIEPSKIVSYWHLDSEEYVAQVGATTGWNWLYSLGNGDHLCFSIIVLLVAATVVLLFVAFVLYLRKKDMWYALISGLTVLVLISAATGLISGGH
jgi:hypothetical protein